MHTPEPSWWTGIDISEVDNFEFYYFGSGVTVNLFSYDPVYGSRISNPIILPDTGGWARIRTNISFLTQGQLPGEKFNLKKFVGVRINGDPGDDTYFDNMYFTAMVVVDQEKAVPGLIVNTNNNIVTFTARARSGNEQITNVFIDLSSLGGPANAAMTNISEYTLFRYSFLVISNQARGNYWIPITAYDNRAYSAEGKAILTIAGKPLYTTLVVYDGDTVKADPEQWVPSPPPATALFLDVDDTTAMPHTGDYSGQYFQTNGSSIIFHRRDPTWSGLDVSSAAALDIWVKGDTGGENITLNFCFLDQTNRNLAGMADRYYRAYQWHRRGPVRIYRHGDSGERDSSE